MNVALQILREIYQLFIDDGRLAMLLLVWSGIVWGVTVAFPTLAAVGGVALVIGYVAILLENVWRYAREKSRDAETSGGGN